MNRWLWPALGAGALIIAVALLVLRGDEPHALAAQTSGDKLTGRVRGGEQVSQALIWMYNRSDEPIVLEGARNSARGKVPSFRFLVAGANRTDDAQRGQDEQCPPSFLEAASIRPVKGFTLQPDSTPAGKQGAVLIFCFTVPPGPGRTLITHTSITYRQDGESRTLTFPNRYTLCIATRGAASRACGGPAPRA